MSHNSIKLQKLWFVQISFCSLKLIYAKWLSTACNFASDLRSNLLGGLLGGGKGGQDSQGIWVRFCQSCKKGFLAESIKDVLIFCIIKRLWDKQLFPHNLIKLEGRTLNAVKMQNNWRKLTLWTLKKKLERWRKIWKIEEKIEIYLERGNTWFWLLLVSPQDLSWRSTW